MNNKKSKIRIFNKTLTICVIMLLQQNQAKAIECHKCLEVNTFGKYADECIDYLQNPFCDPQDIVQTYFKSATSKIMKQEEELATIQHAAKLSEEVKGTGEQNEEAFLASLGRLIEQKNTNAQALKRLLSSLLKANDKAFLVYESIDPTQQQKWRELMAKRRKLYSTADTALHVILESFEELKDAFGDAGPKVNGVSLKDATLRYADDIQQFLISIDKRVDEQNAALAAIAQ